MTRAKSSDRNVIRLGAWCVGDAAMRMPETSGHSPCGRVDILRGARADISSGAVEMSGHFIWRGSDKTLPAQYAVAISTLTLSHSPQGASPVNGVRRYG